MLHLSKQSVLKKNTNRNKKNTNAPNSRILFRIFGLLLYIHTHIQTVNHAECLKRYSEVYKTFKKQ